MPLCQRPRTTTRSSRCIAVAVALTLLAACTSSPPRGTVSGNLFEVGGQINLGGGDPNTPISGAVRAESVGDGQTFDVTVQRGSFALRLPPGDYKLTGRMENSPEFECFVNNGRQPITVTASAITTANVICPIG